MGNSNDHLIVMGEDDVVISELPSDWNLKYCTQFFSIVSRATPTTIRTVRADREFLRDDFGLLLIHAKRCSRSYQVQLIRLDFVQH